MANGILIGMAVKSLSQSPPSLPPEDFSNAIAFDGTDYLMFDNTFYLSFDNA